MERSALDELGMEWFADAIVHTTGLFIGLMASLVLPVVAVRRARTATLPNIRSSILLAFGLYGPGLVAMLTCSALYNLNVDHPLRGLLRRLDHAAIFVMIAGTATPFALVCIRGVKGLKIFTSIWTLAALGVALKLVAPAQFEILSLPAYLLLGWAVLLVYRPLRATMPHPGLPLLAAGCALYSVGVMVFLWNGLHYQLAIWHSFVLVAALCHFTCIVGYATGPTVLGHACATQNT